MWPKRFGIFREFMEDIKTLFLFNTIKSKPEGLTYYDLQQYGDIPHSNIYRMMKDLEEKGDLYHTDGFSSETGRPKHLYFLTKQGEVRLKEIRLSLEDIFEFLKSRFPTSNQNFDHKLFLQEATFKVWAGPVQYILKQESSKEVKLQALSKMEKKVEEHLEEIRNAIKKLEKNY